MSDKNIVQFISKDEWEQGFALEAEKEGPLRLPKEVNRRRVAQNFADAFELVGGTPRLVAFASSSDENYATFLKLYSRLLPAASAPVEDNPVKTIQHVLPRGPLDE